jgi:uncharacterized protein (DUF433 family)
MGSISEREVTAGLSPREAAYVTGVSEKTIHQAIDRHEVEPKAAERPGERGRVLDFSDLVYLHLRQRIGRLLSLEGKRKLRRQLGSPAWQRRRMQTVSIGAMDVNVAPDVEAVEAKLAEMEAARRWVEVNPEVRAGEPVVRGTRIPVHVLADLAAQGASADELLEDYPRLTTESLAAALLYARMHPRRGRPPRAPWEGGKVIRKAG